MTTTPHRTNPRCCMDMRKIRSIMIYDLGYFLLVAQALLRGVLA